MMLAIVFLYVAPFLTGASVLFYTNSWGAGILAAVCCWISLVIFGLAILASVRPTR